MGDLCMCVSLSSYCYVLNCLPPSFGQAQDLETLKKFIQKRKPDVIVVGARGRYVRIV